MDKLDKNMNKQEQSKTGKLLGIPGVSEAIAMVRNYAIKGAAKDAWVRQFICNLPREDASDFRVDEDMIDFDLVDELLDSLARIAGTKVAELWGLSENAGAKIAEIIYWEYCSPDDEGLRREGNYLLPFTLVSNKAPKEIRKLTTDEYLSISKNTEVVSYKGMLPNHLYLDVTYLPYNALHLAYRSIVFCRKWLSLEKQDLREGAPESLNVARALLCADLADSDMGVKEIARKLGFGVYTRDNPSGSHPLFNKYLKKGREIREKLLLLERFLSEELEVLLEEKD